MLKIKYGSTELVDIASDNVSVKLKTDSRIAQNNITAVMDVPSSAYYDYSYDVVEE